MSGETRPFAGIDPTAGADRRQPRGAAAAYQAGRLLGTIARGVALAPIAGLAAHAALDLAVWGWGLWPW